MRKKGGHGLDQRRDQKQQFMSCVTHRDEQGDQVFSLKVTPQIACACFVMKYLQRYPKVDSGATQSMSGVQLMSYVQDKVWVAHGPNMTEMDEIRTSFTFTTNTKGELARPAFLPSRSRRWILLKHQDCLWFALVDTPSRRQRDS